MTLGATPCRTPPSRLPTIVLVVFQFIFDWVEVPVGFTGTIDDNKVFADSDDDEEVPEADVVLVVVVLAMNE